MLMNSSVMCWGRNEYGQIGQGDNVSRGTAAMPMSGVRVIGIGIDNVLTEFIGCGADHVCVMTMNATIRCWGWNIYGQDRVEWNEERMRRKGEEGEGERTEALTAAGDWIDDKHRRQRG